MTSALEAKPIEPASLSSLQREGDITLIDVRSNPEYRHGHVDGATNLPMGSGELETFLRARCAGDEPVYVMCQGGVRSEKVCRAQATEKMVSVRGGLDAWQDAGLPVQREEGGISLERQVRIGAGSLVLTTVLFGFFLHPAFFGLSAFVGAGLVFAGVTNSCAMGMFIARMPWNARRLDSARQQEPAATMCSLKH